MNILKEIGATESNMEYLFEESTSEDELEEDEEEPWNCSCCRC